MEPLYPYRKKHQGNDFKTILNAKTKSDWGCSDNDVMITSSSITLSIVFSSCHSIIISHVNTCVCVYNIGTKMYGSIYIT